LFEFKSKLKLKRATVQQYLSLKNLPNKTNRRLVKACETSKPEGHSMFSLWILQHIFFAVKYYLDH
jgi:hypothetical protein